MTRQEMTDFLDGARRLVRELSAGFAQRLAALEAKDRGIDGKEGALGPQGPKGDPGRDGLQGLMGIPGEDGTDGHDGLGIDQVRVVHDGERTFSFEFVHGDRVKTQGPFTIPSVIYRDIYESGKTYHAGDAVTFGGSVWIARSTTSAKPGEGDTPWRLGVKHGRDGKK